MEGKSINWKKEIWSFIKILAISAIIVFLFVNLIAKPVRVDGDSMYPTLKDGEYGFSSVVHDSTHLDRFDVVVARYEPTNKLWVKRIIGLPGDKIEFKNDKLYINDEEVAQPFLNEEYVNEATSDHRYLFTNDYGPIKLKKNEYFLCGDNRPVSYDSRMVGPFKRKDIVCKNVLVLWPLNEMRVVTDGK